MRIQVFQVISKTKFGNKQGVNYSKKQYLPVLNTGCKMVVIKKKFKKHWIAFTKVHDNYLFIKGHLFTIDYCFVYSECGIWKILDTLEKTLKMN